MVLFVFPNRFSQSSQCVSQDVPNSTTLLSHTLHKLLRCAKGNRLYSLFWQVSNVSKKKQMCDGSIKVSQLINTTCSSTRLTHFHDFQGPSSPFEYLFVKHFSTKQNVILKSCLRHMVFLEQYLTFNLLKKNLFISRCKYPQFIIGVLTINPS
jgi:hypothetical protein